MGSWWSRRSSSPPRILAGKRVAEIEPPGGDYRLVTSLLNDRGVVVAQRLNASTSVGRDACEGADWQDDGIGSHQPRDCHVRQGICEVR